MGKKNSKLETEYSRLSGMSEEQLAAENTKVETELANINTKISSLTEKVTMLAVEIESIKDSDKEEDKATVADKTEKREKLNAALEEAKAEKEKVVKKSERLQGFSKNKVAIQRIIAYRDKFIAQETALKEQKAKNEQEIASKDEEIENIEANKNNTKQEISYIDIELQKIDLELGHIGEINREEDATREIELSQRRNDLEAEKAKKIKEIETYEKQQGTLKQQKSMLEKKNEDIDKKLEKIAVAISKCNLAWKSLFNNKTWEQIQAKSLDGRFTRDKAKEAELKQGAKNPVEETKGKEAVEQAGDPKEKEESPEVKPASVNPAEIKQEEIKEESEVEEAELPAKKSRFQTILSALRHPVQSVKNWMQNRKAEKSEKESKDKDPEEKKTEEKKTEETPVHSTETQRDAFLAQLQKMAEGHEKADIEASAAELQKAAAHKQERRQEDKDR